jgi:HSP90 family molecular chaperone
MFLYGHVEITFQDFELISNAMDALTKVLTLDAGAASVSNRPPP